METSSPKAAGCSDDQIGLGLSIVLNPGHLWEIAGLSRVARLYVLGIQSSIVDNWPLLKSSVRSRSLELRFSPSFASCSCRWRRIVLEVGLACILGQLVIPYAHPQSPDDQPSDTISGTVINSVTHEPIGRALVYTFDEQAAAFTDDGGNFELTLPQAPSSANSQSQINFPTVLQVKKPGYLSSGQGGKPVNRGQKDVTLSLNPEGLIVGHVTFPSADAVDYVQVQLYRREVYEGLGRWQPLTQVQTRADGEFRFADLRAGEYKVFTREAMERDPLATALNGPPYGFPPRFFAAARDFASADTIQLKAGETVTANLSPERQRYYEVKIPVIKPEAGWPGGLSVLVHAQGHSGPGFELGYDPEQNAIRGSLPNGSYTIEGASTDSDEWVGITTITVANGPVNGPPLALSRRTIIDYNVHQDFSSGNSSVAGAPTVYLNLQPADEFSELDQGGFGYNTRGNPPSLTGVRPGRYWVQANPSSSDIYVASVTSGGKDLLQVPLVVPFGASVPPIDITLRNDPGQIEVTVESKTNVPQAVSGGIVGSVGIGRSFMVGGGSSVYCIPISADGGVVRAASGQSGGKYFLPQVPPGDYRILAFDTPQQLEYRNPAAMRAYESRGQVVHVAAGQKAQVTVQPIKSE